MESPEKAAEVTEPEAKADEQPAAEVMEPAEKPAPTPSDRKTGRGAQNRVSGDGPARVVRDMPPSLLRVRVKAGGNLKHNGAEYVAGGELQLPPALVRALAHAVDVIDE